MKRTHIKVINCFRMEEKMIYLEKEIKLKDGRTAILRNAKIEDSAVLIKYLKVTASETPFLIKEPEEITITIEQEENFIRNQIESERNLMLIALIDGNHIGNCSLSSIGSYQRYRHRCSIAIALYKEYWNLGLGCQMLLAVLEQARLCGYEQAELEVAVSNKQAIILYKSLGFEIYGTLKNNMKYKDGTYQDSYLMVKYF